MKQFPKSKKEWQGWIWSCLFHICLLWLMFTPAILELPDLEDKGAGGPGLVGGGGGGNRGTGAERIQFYVPAQVEQVPIEVQKVAPIPTIIPVIEKPLTQDTVQSTKDTEAVASTVGSGGGAGNAGTSGAGVGTGGGVGSGEGTGQGTSTGPGRGGGIGTKYPATPTQLAILPMPVPSKVKPYECEAFFEVDTLGHGRLLSFTKSKDKDYNIKVEKVLNMFKFRPAVLLDGTSVMDTVKVVMTVGK